MRTRIFRCTALLLLLAAGCKRESDEITTPVHQAVERGDMEQLRRCLSRGIDIDVRDWFGRTALLVAAAEGHEYTVTLLLNSGANINATDKWGRSVLYHAILNNETSTAKLLLSRGARVRTQNQDEQPPLHAAVGARDALELVELLLAKGADINAADRNGNTALLEALTPRSEMAFFSYSYGYVPHHEHMRLIRLLVAKGADVNAMNWLGDTPLNRAAEYGNVELAQLLLDSGAQPDRARSPYQMPAVLAMNYDNREIAQLLVEHGADVTLHLAAYLGDLEKVRALIQNAADADARDLKGQTPLHRAACGGQRAVAELLLNSGADVNAWTIERDDYYNHITGYRPTLGSRPLHLAAAHPDVVETLIAHGADVNARDYRGDTPLEKAVAVGNKRAADLLVAAGADISLHLAAYLGYIDKVKSLIEAGADVNARDASEVTPLYLATLHGHGEVMQLLLDHGADVKTVYDRYDIDKGTVLHKAAQLGYADVARTLLAHGADVRARDEEGDTPLHAAAYYGWPEVIDVLLAHGADPNAETEQGRTPLVYGQEAGFADVVQRLGGSLDDLKRGPYRVTVADVNTVRVFVANAFYDTNVRVEALWIPEQTALNIFEGALKTHLRETFGERLLYETVFANLRRFHREYGGFTSQGKQYIVCNLHLGYIDDTPPDNNFSTGVNDEWWSHMEILFNVESETIIRINPA